MSSQRLQVEEREGLKGELVWWRLKQAREILLSSIRHNLVTVQNYFYSRLRQFRYSDIDVSSDVRLSDLEDGAELRIVLRLNEGAVEKFDRTERFKREAWKILKEAGKAFIEGKR